MKPFKVFYRGEEIQSMFILPNPKKVDINHGKKHIKGIDKSELMVRLVDAEKHILELEEKIEKIKEIIT